MASMNDRAQVMGPPEGLFTIVVVAALVGFVLVAVVDQPSQLERQFETECENRLGDEWDYHGYFSPVPDTVDHYDVQCRKDSGLLSHEKHWITVPKENVTVN